MTNRCEINHFKAFMETVAMILPNQFLKEPGFRITDYNFKYLSSLCITQNNRNCIMHQLIYILFLSFSFLSNESAYHTEKVDICASKEEQNLYILINKYRQKNGLNPVPFSAALTKVAQVHARDLVEHYKRGTDCNPHSWSDHGEWTGCCYTNDHKEARCMWDKPKEISGYPGAGYEIVYWHSALATAPGALAGWQKSPNHDQIIMNANMWKEATWNAIGVGIYKQYAVVWFGQEKDSSGKPGRCD